MTGKTVLKTAALALTAAFALAMCGRTQAQTGGVAASGGGSPAARSSARANPASDFSYDLTEDGQGILIKGYSGTSKTVVIPDKIEDYPVLEIGSEAFYGEGFWMDFNTLSYGTKPNSKAEITSITIPNTVRKIGSKAFANTAITSFDMPGSVTEIGGSAFENTAITRFNMPDSVTKIGSNIFSGCKNLTEIRLSDNITRLVTLGGSALSSGMPALKKVNLPRNLREIKGYALYGCGELTDLTIPDSIQSVRFLKWLDDDEETSNNAFTGCGKLPLATRAKIQGWGYTSGF